MVPSSDSRFDSLWLATSDVPQFPKLTERLDVDVAIIGGGIVGVLCAHRLAHTGRKVALLEARRVLHGVTGNTTAKVSASHGVIYSHIESQFGEKEAGLYGKANLSAIDWIESTAVERGIECDFRRKDLYLYAEDDKARDQVAAESRAASKAGLDSALIDELETPFPSSGAAVFRNQAEFHPVKFLVPLLQDAIAHGAVVHEGVMIEEVDEEDDYVELETTDGVEIRAQHVIEATHFPFFDPAMYYARLDPFRDYAIAVELEEPFAQAMYVGSQDGYTYRSQPTEDGELLIVSGGGHKVGKEADTERFFSDMEAFTRKHFKVRNVRYRWSTQDNDTLDKVPYVGKISANAERVFVACGFGGWGMTQSVVSMMLLTDLINGKHHPCEELFDPRRFKPITSAGTMAKIGVDSVKGLIVDRFTGGSGNSPSELKAGEAEVLNLEGGKCGAYRSEDGELHVVSAVCTHMGCILAWNNSERSWDCPCHGSRFSYSGKVLHGPAVKDLERKSIQ